MTDPKLSPPVAEGNIATLADERVRRLKVEVERRAGQSPSEWMFWLEDVAKQHGIEPAKLAAMIRATQADREKATREAKAELERSAKRHKNAEREAKAEVDRARKDEERARKEDEQKRKAIAAELKTLLKLPTVAREKRLADLAEQFDVDIEDLRAELEVFLGPRDDTAGIEPWPEPVATADLLRELNRQIQRYIAVHDDAAVAIAMWAMFAWVHESAVHSPTLTITSAEMDSGKTTLLGVLGYLTPTPYPTVELTGPGLFHIVDHLKPTMLVDEADRLFQRKNDLLHIMNAGWTRGTKITRLVHGVPCKFDPWCPKVIGLKGMGLPSTLASRAVVVWLWPKLPNERLDDFGFHDDETFETLRRKCARWATDHADKVKGAQPAMPLGFNNRLAANWRTLFAIAELAGCLEQAHRAAVSLSSRRSRQVSEGVRLLAAVREILGSRSVIASAELVKKLIADRDAEWCEFRGRPITQRQVAALLAPYDIVPKTVHPTGRSDSSPRGYEREQFAEIFARFLPRDPHIRTLGRKKPAKLRRK